MREDERVWAVKDLLFDYLKSPSLRDPHSVIRLAQAIVRRIDQGNSIWRKLDGQRELLLPASKKAIWNCSAAALVSRTRSAMPGFEESHSAAMRLTRGTRVWISSLPIGIDGPRRY
jgi:hypothetical protein